MGAEVNPLPHDLDSEKAVLGCALLSQEAAEGVTSTLTASDYHIPQNGAIHDAIAKLVSRMEPVDPTTIAATSKRLSEPRAKAYLLDLPTFVTSALNWQSHANTVKRCARLRRIITVAGEASAASYESGDPDEILAKLARDAEASTNGHSRKVRQGMPEIIGMFRERVTTIRDTEFGLTLRDGDSAIIAAWPGVGKSALAAQMARQFGDRHLECVIYSLEMSEKQWYTRYIAATTGMTLEELESGIGDAVDGLAATVMQGDWPDFVTLVDDAALTIPQIVGDIRRRARKGLRVAFIDYLQLLCKQDFESVTETSRVIKKLARETGVPIVSLSQLRRPSADAPRKPTMHHLKQSGALEADADLIVLLSQVPEESALVIRGKMKDGGWLVEDPAYDGKKLCIYDVAKNRHGKTFDCPAYFDGGGMTWQQVERTADEKRP